MQITLVASDDDTCSLAEQTNSSSNRFTIPVAKDTLVAFIRDMLADPEKREAGNGPVMIDRTRDGLRIHAGSGTFTVPYPHVFPLVAE